MTAANTKWKLQGDYFEGCNCDSICPCIFKGDPDEGFCNLTAAWHIQNGSYDKIKVDDAINAKGEPFPAEPLIMTLLLSQQKMIDWLIHQTSKGECRRINKV
jgi:Protein of unknown function (DUF1326)